MSDIFQISDIFETSDISALKAFLNRKAAQFETPDFIASDPISIPHLFTKKQDIEISAFFASIFAWGNRTTIINKSRGLMKLMDDEPHAFILHHSSKELKTLLEFKHRTFNTTDLLYFIKFLKFHYSKNASLQSAFFHKSLPELNLVENALNYFYKYFFSLTDAPDRTRKHIAAPQRRSTCKRLNMFLRWMIRSREKGVDFGLWDIHPSHLICPIDIHVARVAKHFKLLSRKSIDWQAALELTNNLRKLDDRDPVKYDYALFGLGVMEKFR